MFFSGRRRADRRRAATPPETSSKSVLRTLQLPSICSSRQSVGPPLPILSLSSLQRVQVRPLSLPLSSLTTPLAGQPLPPHLPTPFRTTLRHLLTHELDISSVPRVSFFEWLASFSTGDMQEKLRWFCEGEGQVRSSSPVANQANNFLGRLERLHSSTETHDRRSHVRVPQRQSPRDI